MVSALYKSFASFEAPKDWLLHLWKTEIEARKRLEGFIPSIESIWIIPFSYLNLGEQIAVGIAPPPKPPHKPKTTTSILLLSWPIKSRHSRDRLTHNQNPKPSYLRSSIFLLFLSTRTMDAHSADMSSQVRLVLSIRASILASTLPSRLCFQGAETEMTNWTWCICNAKSMSSSTSREQNERAESREKQKAERRDVSNTMWQFVI